MSREKTCFETIQTTGALVGLGMMAVFGRITQAEYNLGTAYVMGYQDAEACRPCDPMETIDKFKEVDE